MKKLKLVVGLMAGSVTLTACLNQEMPTEAAMKPAAPSFSTSTAPTETSYLISFRSGIPADLSSRLAAVGGRVEERFGQVGIVRVSGIDAAGAASLRGRSDVEAVGEDELVKVSRPVDISAPRETSGPAAVDPTLAPYYPWQWNMRAIGAEKAWAAGYTGKGATVAVLDTGVDPSHLDLAGRVDMVRSRSMAEGDPRYVEDVFLDFYFPTAPRWVDLHYHGTHVASTVSSNAARASGVASEATIMAVKVLAHIYDPEEDEVFVAGYTSTVLEGILHAVDSGADVINMSLGGAFDRVADPETLRSIEKTLNYALRKGVAVVVSAGNDATDINGNGEIYETYCESLQVICVTATGAASSDDEYEGPWYDVDSFADYSNYGKYAVSVAAPGGTGPGKSWIWAACSRYSLYIGCDDGHYVVGLTGTSMASPHVAGLAALMTQRYGKRNGLLIRLLISGTADDFGARGRDAYYGWGRINVASALGIRSRWSWR